MDRSNIDLLGNSTSGINLGTGDGVFKCKDLTGNTLQFKTLKGSAGIIIVTGDTELTFSGTTGGLPVISGMSNYVLRVNSSGTDIEASSILDSGSTNICIQKNNIFLGNNSGITLTTIRPSYNGIIQMVASSGVNIGSLNDCLCVGHTTEGLTVCAAAYCDLIVHAGSAVSSGQAGKTLCLSGGDGIGAAGGNVVLTGGTGSVGGNIILSTSNSGRVRMIGLPAKSTETCAIYVNSNGCLSTGLVCTGNTTIAGGTVNVIPKFNSIGNNIQNSSLTINSNVLSNNDTLTIQVPDTKCLYLASKQGSNNYLILGSPTQTGVNAAIICPAGISTDINIMLTPKGSGSNHLLASYNYMGPGGPACNGLQVTSNTLWLPSNVIMCGHAGSTSSNNGKFVCINGGHGVSQVGYAGSGGTLYLNGGSANDGIGATPKAGGCVVLKAGLGASGGANGRVQICSLPLKSAETCGIYIDANGNLSYGVISGGTGGGSVGVTGATNGVCLYNSKNVCLGGAISAPVTLGTTGTTNAINLCSTNNNCCGHVAVNCGYIYLCSKDNALSWCGNVFSSQGTQGMWSSNALGACINSICVRPDAIYINQTGGAGNTGLQYVADYSAKFNANNRAIPDAGWVKSCIAAGDFWSRPSTYVCPLNSLDSVRVATASCYSWGNGAFMQSSTPSGTNTWCLSINPTSALEFTAASMLLGKAALLYICDSSSCAITIYPNGIICTNGNMILNSKDTTTATKACPTKICAGGSISTGAGGDVCIAAGNATVSTGAGGDVRIFGGCASSGSGGCIFIDTKNMLGGANGRVYVNGLPLATTETCVLYIDGSCRLSYGVVAGGGGGIGWSNLTCASTVAGCDTPATTANIWCDTFFGVSAGKNTTNAGHGNTGVGASALKTNTSGICNTAVGMMSLSGNTTGNYNAAMGAGALAANTTGSFNTAVGSCALCKYTTGTYNTAIGYGAMLNSTGGTGNIGIGIHSLCRNGGTGNIAIGTCALCSNTTGGLNIAIGGQSLCANSTGAVNIAIGTGTLMRNTTGLNNLAIGWGALNYNTTGINNIALGCQSLYQNSVGNNNIALGHLALNYNTGSNNMAFGLCSLLSNTTGINNIAMGVQSMCSNISGGYNTSLGYQTLFWNNNGYCNVAIGPQALYFNSSGNRNIGIGEGSLYYLSSGANNIAIGSYALCNNGAQNENIAIGRVALCSTTGSFNIGIGTQAYVSQTSAACNVGIGYQVGQFNTTGSQNVAVGYSAAYCLKGNCNVSLGAKAGFGSVVGSTGNANVFIGYEAGLNETGSNRLHIANTQNCTLIYGEFDSKCVKICGKLEASGGIVPTSSTDAGMPNNTIYYSTTAGKLVYKDSGGIVNTLY